MNNEANTPEEDRKQAEIISIITGRPSITPSPASYDASDNFTYGDLLNQLQHLTPAQLNQQARWINEGGNGKVASLWVLDQDYVDPSGDGMEPASAYTAEELEHEQRWPAGLVMLQQA